jgi:hypothetical protein
VIDREEVVLRAAALILDRLRNGAAVWTDVLDEVGELLPTRRAAQQAAWAALREHIDANYFIVWGGPKGARWLAFANEDRSRQIACPKCGAQAGEACSRMRGGKPIQGERHAHPERQIVALAPSMADVPVPA